MSTMKYVMYPKLDHADIIKARISEIKTKKKNLWFLCNVIVVSIAEYENRFTETYAMECRSHWADCSQLNAAAMLRCDVK